MSSSTVAGRKLRGKPLAISDASFQMNLDPPPTPRRNKKTGFKEFAKFRGFTKFRKPST